MYAINYPSLITFWESIILFQNIVSTLFGIMLDKICWISIFIFWALQFIANIEMKIHTNPY